MKINKHIKFIALALVITAPAVVFGQVTIKQRPGYSVAINSSALNGPQSGLLAVWSFDASDLNSTNLFDRSGRGIHGTLNSFSSRLLKTFGKKGEALIFDGVDDNISLGDVAEATRLTVTAWVKPSAVKGGMKIISKKASGSGAQYSLSTSADNIDKFSATFNTSAISADICESVGASGTYEANKWYFVAATYDGDTCVMYVNGVNATEVVSDLASGNLLNGTSALRIGADGGSSIAAGSYFSGAIDEARVYNRALTLAEIENLYSAGSPVKIRSVAVPH